MFQYLQYLGSAFLGWSLGANDSANVFGTAVSSGMVHYRTATILTAIFVITGALFQGQKCIKTISSDLTKKEHISANTGNQSEIEIKKEKIKFLKRAMIASFAAALTVTIMTIMKIPVSTSQAVVGAIIGIGIMNHNVNMQGLGKVVVCWIGTPIGAMILTVIFYYIFAAIFRKWRPSVFVYDPVISFLLILCGCYGAYALGANNVANVSAVFVGHGMMTAYQAALFGSVAIAIGALTYSKPVMKTVGKAIIQLDSFTAFICVLSHAVTVHIYAFVGVPVSTSQAIVGAVLGIGIIKGVHIINYKTLFHVFSGWTATPFVAGCFSALGYFIANLRYVPS